MKRYWNVFFVSSVCAAVLDLPVIKDIHQDMTVALGSIALWDLGNHDSCNQKHTGDVPQIDSSCFLLRCDSFTNHERYVVMRQWTSEETTQSSEQIYWILVLFVTSVEIPMDKVHHVLTRSHTFVWYFIVAIMQIPFLLPYVTVYKIRLLCVWYPINNAAKLNYVFEMLLV